MITTEIQLTPFQKYLISCIDADEYNCNPETIDDKINHVLKCFEDEYGNDYIKKRYPNDIVRFKEWIQGLPSCFGIAFSNSERLDLAVLFGFIPANATEEEENDFLENWFLFVAKGFFKIKSKI